MRNKVLLGLLFVGVFALGVLSVRAWDHYKVTERVKAEYSQYQQEKQAQEQQRAEEARAKLEADEKQKLHDACVANAQKARTSVATCNIEQVE